MTVYKKKWLWANGVENMRRECLRMYRHALELTDVQHVECNSCDDLLLAGMSDISIPAHGIFASRHPAPSPARRSEEQLYTHIYMFDSDSNVFEIIGTVPGFAGDENGWLTNNRIELRLSPGLASSQGYTKLARKLTRSRLLGGHGYKSS